MYCPISSTASFEKLVEVVLGASSEEPAFYMI
jgi:hypothetical protein